MTIQYVLLHVYYNYIQPRPSRYSGSKYLQAMDPLYEDVVWANENSSCDSERNLSNCFMTQAEVSVNVSTAVVCVYPIEIDSGLQTTGPVASPTSSDGSTAQHWM